MTQKAGQKLQNQFLSICLILVLDDPLSCSFVNILTLNRTHLLNTTMKRLLTIAWIFHFVQETMLNSGNAKRPFLRKSPIYGRSRVRSNYAHQINNRSSAIISDSSTVLESI